MTLRQELDKAIRDSDRTGLKIRKRVDKKQMLTEFPELARQDFFAVTPETYTLDIAKHQAVQVGELRDLCQKCPDHPLSSHIRLACAAKVDDRTVYILTQDYNALKQAAEGTTDAPI